MISHRRRWKNWLSGCFSGRRAETRRRNRTLQTPKQIEVVEQRLMLDATYFALATGNFSQDWTDTNLITTNDDWSGVPSIVGFRGDGLTGSTGSDPQTILADDTPGVVDVIANQTAATSTSGGVGEFDGLTNPAVGLQGSGTADAPYLQLHLDTTGRNNIQISYLLRDLDGGGDDAIQQVALQYRVGTSGDFTNIASGFVADATTGGSATQETPVSAVLPIDAENQSQVQIRIMTANAGGSDEWVGIDDIVVTSDGGAPVPALLISQTGGKTEVTEGGMTDSFTVSLNQAPSSHVTVTLTPANAQIDLGSGPGVAHALTFTSANGTDPQTVTVTAIDDAVVEGLQQVAVSFSSSSTDAGFNGLTATDLTVAVFDNDFAGLVPPQTNDFETDSGAAGLGDGWTVFSTDADSANTWYAATDGGDRLAEVNAFGDSVAADDWLIAPPINLDTTTGEFITFDTWTRFSDAGIEDPEVRFLYSTDYSGVGDPTAATWTELAYAFPAENSQTYTPSGSIDVSGISGDLVWFAFQYTSSGVGAADSSQWRVNNFSIQPGTAAPIFGIAAADASKAEGNSGTTPFTFTVTRSGNTSGADSVDYSVTGAATNGADAADFGGSLPTNVTVNFADGETSKDITIDVAGDTDQEATEGFVVTLSNPSRSGTIDPATADGTIIDDDAPAPVVWINEFHYDDDAGDLNEFVEVAGTAGTDLTGWTIVHYNGNGGGVISTINLSGTIDDEGSSGFGALEFSGEPSGFQNGNDGFALVNALSTVVEFISYEGTFDATAGPASGMSAVDVGAGIAETNSTPSGFSLQRNNAVPGVPGAWAGPFDDSPGTLNVFPAPSFEVTPLEAVKAEGNTGDTTTFTFTITRSGDTSGANDVTWAVTGAAVNGADASDFSGAAFPSATETFAAGETSRVITVQVQGDTDVEPDERFTVTLSNATGGATITTATAEGTIQNDDAAPATITVTIAPASISENGGTATGTITLSSNATTDVTVTLVSSDTSEATVPANVIITAGSDSNTFTIAGIDDLLVDGTQSVTISATAAGYADGSETVNVTDDELGATDLFINEILINPIGSDTGNEYIELRGTPGGIISSDTYLVVLEGDSASNGLVDHIFTLGGMQFGSNGYLVLLQAGNSYVTDSNATVATATGSGWGTDFSSRTNDIENGSTSFLLITSPTAPTAGADVDSANNATLDGDAASWTILDSIGNIDGGPSDTAYGAINISGNGDGLVPSGSVLINVAIQPLQNGSYHPDHLARLGDSTGSVQADWVFGEIAGTLPNLSLAAGATIPSNLGGAALNHIGSTNAFDAPETLVVDITPTEFSENGGTTTVHVSRTSEDISGALVVNLSSSDTTETNVPATVTILAGAAEATFALTAVDDAIVDGTQTVTITANAAGYLNGMDSIDVTDDDAAVAISADVTGAAEGNSGTTNITFTVTRTGSLSAAATVDWAVTSTQADGADFGGGALPSGTLNFAAGEATQTITVQVQGDTNVEANEGFVVSLSNPSAGIVIDVAAAGSIIQNDDTSLSIVADQSSLAEGNSGATDFTFTVTRSGDPTGVLNFGPLTESAPISDATDEDTGSFVVPAGWTATKLTSLKDIEADATQSAVRVAALGANGSMWDMSAFSPDGRFIFIPHETQYGAGVSRFDTTTGKTVRMFEGDSGGATGNWSNDFGALDPAIWNPYNGNLIVAEEWSGQGRLFEIADPTKAVSGPDEFTPVHRTAIPSVSHEGLKFDNDGHLYFVDENSSGSIYKFVPTTVGDLTAGQTFVLKADAAGDAATGHAVWVPITNADGTAAAAGLSSNPFDFNSRGGRAAADEVGSTGYSRPEDLEFGMLANGKPVLYVAVMGTNSVYSIELTDAANAEVRLMANASTPFNAGCDGTTATLASPDNLAIDAQCVIEDQANSTTNGVPGGDVFLLRDVDGDGVAESLDHVLSHSVPGAEITGMTFSPVNPHEFIISIQHPASTAVAGGTGDALWLITMPGAATSSPLTDSGATVNWAVTSTQADGVDFVGGTLPSGQLTFAAGEFSKTITVQVQGDTDAEADELFTVTLSNAVGASVALASADSTITNDDAANFKLQVLHASDLEGGVDAISRAANFATIVDALEADAAAQGIGSILLSAGDNYIPGPFFNASGDASLRTPLQQAYQTLFGEAGLTNIREGVGRVDISIMNILGFDAAAIGNHEFDAGPGTFGDLIRADIRGANLSDIRWLGAEFPYLSSNLNFGNDGGLNGLFTADILPNTAFQSDLGDLTGTAAQPSLAPATTILVNGEWVGVVGATTQLIEQISSTGDTTVIGPNANDMPALAAILQPVIDDVLDGPDNVAGTADDVNKVILVSHLQQLALEQSLIGLLNGVDIVIAGGSDTLLADDNDILRPGDTADAQYPVFTHKCRRGSCRHRQHRRRIQLCRSTGGQGDMAGILVAPTAPEGVSDANVSGAYATDDAGVVRVTGAADAATAIAASIKGTEVQKLTDAVSGVVTTKDGIIHGRAGVFLEGRREAVRTEETNMGNLTADANLAAAKAVDSSVLISLKNGGGIRAEIGTIDGFTGETGPTGANPASGKLAGEISQLDIENSLRFNNLLSIVTVTPTELLAILEHGVAATGPGNTPGQFPQVGGLSFSFDPSQAPGSRIGSVAIVDELGNVVDVIKDSSGIEGDPARTIRMVTLSFLADGGDGYPIPATGRVDTGLGEQTALADYLTANHATVPYYSADTPVEQDRRIQNLAFRPDTVLSEVATQEIPLTHISTLTLSGAEISAFDPGSDRLFVTSGGGLEVVDFSDPHNPVQITLIDPISSGTDSSAVTSVAVGSGPSAGIVAIAVPDATITDAGDVLFYRASDLAFLGSVEVGALPDMLTFSPDGTRLLVANEGQSANGDNHPAALPNPNGGISIVTLNVGDLSESTVGTFEFTDASITTAALQAKGVRIHPAAPSAAADLEPEYITVEGNTAYITLQENNAIAVVNDVTSFTGFDIDDIIGLGTKDHTLPFNALDTSDRDSGVEIRTAPVRGVYMPDAIDSYTVGGMTYFVTANEGDGRGDADAGGDEARVKDFGDTGFPALDGSALLFQSDQLTDAVLGRLTASSIDGDTDNDGDIDQIHAFGGRSFSIWDSAGNQVWDSGSFMDRFTALSGSFDDGRSDNKGAEPEGVTLATIGGMTFAFVGLERTNDVMVFNVTDPTNVRFVDNINIPGDISPEGLIFIDAASSPTGNPLLVITNEVSQTLTTIELAPALTLTIDATEIAENGGTATGTVTREGDLSSAVTVTLTNDDSTEISHDTTVTIPANQASATFTITGLDDTVVDGTQTVALMAKADGYSSGAAMLDVTDANSATVSIAGTKDAREAGLQNGKFVVTSTLASESDITVAYTVSGTATSGSDFAALSGSVVIVAGSTTADIDVPVLDDGLAEQIESLVISLDLIGSVGTVAADAANNSSQIQVISDDLRRIKATPATLTVSETGTTATFDVTLGAQPTSDVVITVVSSNEGEATVSTATLTFTPSNWDVPQMVTVTGVDDLVADGTQELDITLSVDTAASDTAWQYTQDVLIDVLNTDDEAPAAVIRLEDVTFYNEDAILEDGLSVEQNGQRSIIRRVQVVLEGEMTITAASVTDGTFSLLNQTTGTNVGLVFESATASNGRTVVVLSFAAGASVEASGAVGSLIDGNYELTINGGPQSFDADKSGTSGGEEKIRFHRLFGDSDGDRDVDGADYGNFFRAYYGDAAFSNVFDRDDDDDLLEEFGAFFSNFGRHLPPL
ncbi:MAG: choice-of-anchor I family protein [Planctomycetaceae bacterium]